MWADRFPGVALKGFSLKDIGIDNVAFRKSEALDVLDLLLSAGVGVLGGDVYVINTGKLSSGYASWYYDRLASMPPKEFAKNSIDRSRDYITTFPAKSDDILFAIVPDL